MHLLPPVQPILHGGQPMAAELCMQPAASVPATLLHAAGYHALLHDEGAAPVHAPPPPTTVHMQRPRQEPVPAPELHPKAPAATAARCAHPAAAPAQPSANAKPGSDAASGTWGTPPKHHEMAAILLELRNQPVSHPFSASSEVLRYNTGAVFTNGAMMASQVLHAAYPAINGPFGASMQSPNAAVAAMASKGPSTMESTVEPAPEPEPKAAIVGPVGVRKAKKRRGNLPKAATQNLKQWLFNHLMHPYPNEEEKRQLSATVGLTTNQISNWFINARRRILQPMVNQAKALQFTRSGPSAESRAIGSPCVTATAEPTSARSQAQVPLRADGNQYGTDPASAGEPASRAGASSHMHYTRSRGRHTAASKNAADSPSPSGTNDGTASANASDAGDSVADQPLRQQSHRTSSSSGGSARMRRPAGDASGSDLSDAELEIATPGSTGSSHQLACNHGGGNADESAGRTERQPRSGPEETA